ncbi:MAG: phosphate ABC transporter substrate-binding protein [Oscillibacter sp.]|nr:phosphate ABC transporter substrate-binding protein [Oscillibacter sp.]
MGKRAAAFLLALLLAGCGGGTARTVELDGSTAMSGVVAALQEAFRQREPGIRINCSGSGSGAGIEGVLEGRCDIGLSSRELTEEEAARGAVGRMLALDGIAVIVHPDNPVSALTREQLAAVFTGKIDRWTEQGGEDRPVAVYGREAGSGTRTAFEAALGVTDRCAYRNEYCSTGDVVGNVAANPNAIGYVSLSSVNGTVKALSVDGVRCRLDTVRDGTYPICRPFLLVTREGTALSEEAGAFLDFAESEEVEPYLAMAGAAAQAW